MNRAILEPGSLLLALCVVTCGCRTANPPTGHTPELSADGKSFVFDAERNGKYHIFRYDIEDQRLTQLTPDETCDYAPTVSGDGEWLAFTRQAGSREQLWVQKLRGDGSSHPISGSLTLDQALKFSADGQSLYFIRTTWAGGRLLRPRFDLYKVQATFPETKPQRVRESTLDVASNEEVFAIEELHRPGFSLSDSQGSIQFRQSGWGPRFSSDDTKLTWVHLSEEGKSVLAVRNLHDKKEIKGSIPFGFYTLPRFSLDGRWVVYRVLASERGAKPKVVILNSADLSVTREVPLD